MDFWEVIETRKSVRSFREDPIPEDVLVKMIEAARLSPSARNKQCWRFVFVDDPNKKKQLAFKSGIIGKINFFINKAPLIVVACAYPGKSVRLNDKDYYLVDTAIAFQQMMLTAWNFGVGSCWLAAFSEKHVRKILEIPPDVNIVGLSPFGYPKNGEDFYGKAVKFVAASQKRMNRDEIVCRNIWQFS